jgi:hypothetical protein
MKIAAAALATSMIFSATAASAVTLVNVDPVAIDTTAFSVNGTMPAAIDFINHLSSAVDVYWINYSGDRVFYYDLAADSSYVQGTYITHPWLIALAGSGDTTAQGSGTLITAFASAVTPSSVGGPDIANIGAVPEPATWATMFLGMSFAGAVLRRRRATIAA